MTVTVVPILRLRRATRGWSYKIPESAKIQPGALVIIPFRNRPTLGVVWDSEETGKATLSVTEILTHTPLVRAPQRLLVEWIASEGITSLSTALYSWLPASLRAFPLTRPVRDVLGAWDANQPTSRDIALAKQHAVLTPSIREAAESGLRAKYGEQFQSTFSDTTPAQEFETWVAIAQGRCHLATGRERALYAPWINLRHVTVIEPEDISYQTGQSPFLNLVKGAEILAEAASAELTFRTNVPLTAAHLLWKEASGFPFETPEVELTDLRKERPLNAHLISRVRKVLEAGKNVVILYNAHDRFKLREDGMHEVIPGIETLSRQLATALGSETLPYSVHLGTRSILHTPLKNVGLSVILSLDPLLSQSNLADQIHGWSDIGKLCSFGAPLLVQTRTPEHDLPQSLLRKSFEQYCVTRLEEAQQVKLPPFCEHIVCATTGSLEDAQALADQLFPLISDPWQIGHPRPVERRGKAHSIITLHAPLGTRIPEPVRKILASLPRPWKVERSPWYAG